jgi:hypothetical protein
MDPILIVGSPRSGTTALALALNAAGVSGFPEGHFLMLFARIEQTIARYYQDEANNVVPGTLLHAMPIERVVEDYRHAARSMIETIHEGKTWFDKTAHGGMIGSLPFFIDLWPHAKVIFAKRRPIENLESRRKKFRHMSFAEHCRDLRYIYSTWAEIRDRIDNWLEVDQYDLAIDPNRTVRSISEFLHLSTAAEMAFYDTVAHTHPEKSSPSYTPLKFFDLPWPQNQKEIFIGELGEVMKLYNYGYETYYAADGDQSKVEDSAAKDAVSHDSDS